MIFCTTLVNTAAAIRTAKLMDEWFIIFSFRDYRDDRVKTVNSVVVALSCRHNDNNIIYRYASDIPTLFV